MVYIKSVSIVNMSVILLNNLYQIHKIYANTFYSQRPKNYDVIKNERYTYI